MSVQVAILPQIIAKIDNERELNGDNPNFVLRALINTFGARTRYANHTHELAIAGLKVTSTAGGFTLIGAWKARATRVIAEQAR